MQILVVEDAPEVARTVQRALDRAGHDVDVAITAEQAAVLLHSRKYDVIVLDVELPGRSGIDLLTDLRNADDATPVLMISGRGSLEDVVRGLDAGADDYITKPFELAELIARVRSVQRRVKMDESDRVVFGPVSIDRARHVAMVGGAAIDLTLTEFKLLELFVKYRGAVLHRATLLERVWGTDDPQSNLVDVHVGNLRRKLAKHLPDGGIETVRGLGFRLNVARSS